MTSSSAWSSCLLSQYGGIGNGDQKREMSTAATWTAGSDASYSGSAGNDHIAKLGLDYWRWR
jgi:hypothetical protein